MGEARTRSEAYPPLPDPARRRPTGSRGGSLTAATSMSGWVQSARKQPESERTIREMARCSSSPRRSSAPRPPRARCEAWSKCASRICACRSSGCSRIAPACGWFVAAARGVGVKRADIVRSIEGVSALRQDRVDQEPSRDPRRARGGPRPGGVDRRRGRGARGVGPPVRTSARSSGRQDRCCPTRSRIWVRWAGRRCAPTTSTSPSHGRRMSCAGRSSEPAQPSDTSTSTTRGRRAASCCDRHVRSSSSWRISSTRCFGGRPDPARSTCSSSTWSARSSDVVASCRMEFDHADLVVRAPDALVDPGRRAAVGSGDRERGPQRARVRAGRLVGHDRCGRRRRARARPRA